MFVEQLPIWISHYGYIAIFLLLMLGIVGLPVPDETLLTLLGYLILKGDLRFAPALMTALAGAICGISVSYTIGRTGGMALVKKHGIFLHVNDARLALVRQWFDRIGKWSLMLGYFIPGVRHIIAITAGISGLRLPTFMLFAYTGALIWSVVFITAGYIIGKEWRRFSEAMHGFILWTVLIIAIIIAGYVAYRNWLKKNN
jgi:membrane protein DedA with SNARE-associated domain